MRVPFRALAALSLALTTTGVFAQAPDTVLLNGKIVTAGERNTIHQALALRDGRIVALGKSAAMKRLAGKQTRVFDPGGRTVIPGLIDSHMHAIRAALSYGTEVHWFGTKSIEETLGRLRAAARAAKPGAWLVVALGWMLDGKSAGGVALRGAEETPSRIEALRMYASGSAWFAHDEARRGTLAAGKLADLAVLTKDYLSVPVDEISGIHSLLTMVGGRVVYAEGPFARFEERR